MGDKSRPDQNLCAAAAALALLCAAPLLGGCAVNSYAGIPFAAGAADPELQSLAVRAQAGDKQAQLELGIVYEEGRLVPQDLRKAARLYRAASRATSRSAIVPTPYAQNYAGRLQFIGTGEIEGGLPEARRRLASLRRAGR